VKEKMEIVNGLSIHPGIVMGQAYVLTPVPERDRQFDLQVNQKELLFRALSKSTRELEETIAAANALHSERIQIIFEAHKLMVNDPALLETANLRIDRGLSAYEAYQKAAQEIISRFRKLDSAYMRDRIIDIEDATDRVLSAISDTEYEQEFTFSEPRILILPKMKPSILMNCNRSAILGFVSSEGSYDQHSAEIARSIDLPGLVVNDSLPQIHNGDFVLLDSDHGKLYYWAQNEMIDDNWMEKTVKS
jgi:phosphotransferase system enzyme I (PtsI)